MPEVEHTTEVPLPIAQVWAFVSDMNLWAPFLTGYQKHEIIDATDSIWTLKGDVGILSRIVELRAHVTEWVEPDRVAFTLTGINEPVEGGGTVILERATPAGADSANAVNAAPATREGWFQRLLRWLFRLVNPSSPGRAALPPSAERSRLKLTLRMDAGGATGPLVNAMLGPALEAAVEDLANAIADHLVKLHAG